MKRFVTQLFVGFLLLLSLVIIGLWVLDRPGIFVLQLRTPYTETSLVCGQGCFQFVRLNLDYTTPQYMLDWGQTVPPPAAGWHVDPFVPEPEFADMYQIWQDIHPWPSWSWAPFQIARGGPSNWFSESPPFAEGWQLSLRYWFCLAFTLVLPLVWFVHRHRTRHLRQRGFPVVVAARSAV